MWSSHRSPREAEYGMLNHPIGAIPTHSHREHFSFRFPTVFFFYLASCCQNQLGSRLLEPINKQLWDRVLARERPDSKVVAGLVPPNSTSLQQFLSEFSNLFQSQFNYRVVNWECRDPFPAPRPRPPLSSTFFQEGKGSGSRNHEDRGSRPARANSLRDPISKKPITKKGWWSGSRCRPWVQIPVPQK
jgi:hypothetical protein